MLVVRDRAPGRAGRVHPPNGVVTSRTTLPPPPPHYYSPVDELLRAAAGPELASAVARAVGDPGRLDALRDSALLDSEAEAGFDRLTRLAADLLDAPVAAVSLVDADRHFFKSCVGLPAEVAASRALPMTHAVCRYVVTTGAPFVVPDARVHPLMRDDPALRDLNVVSYLGVPLVAAGGHTLGSLCVVDGVPREWTDRQQRQLTDLAASVMTEVALRAEVTTRCRAAAALSESEARYRLMFERSPCPMWVFDAETYAFLAVNDAAVAHYGWTRDEFLGMTVLDIRPPDAQPAFRAVCTNAEPGRVLAGEHRHRRRDGREMTVDVVSHGLTWRDRSARLVLATDVTEARTAAAALRASEERFRLLSASSPVGVYLTDPLGRATYVNPRLAQITRTTEAALLGNGWLSLVHPDDAAALSAAWARAATDGGEYEQDLRLLTGDGEVRWVRGRLVPLRDAHGALTGSVGTVEDVTERRRLDAERSALAEHLRLLLDSTSEGMYGMDTEGRVTFVNRAAAAALGRTPAELIGIDAHSAWHHTRADGTPYPVEQCSAFATMRGGAGVRSEDELFWRADGTSFAVHLSAQRITDDAGTVRGVVVLFSDVTERRRLEEQLRHAQKMDAVGRLAGGVAHDFNNLLTVIAANMEFLAAELEPGSQARADADEVSAAADRAAALTRQLLAFSRKQVLLPQVLDPNAVVAGVERLLRRVIGETIALVAELAPDVGRLRADPGQVEQVLVNLVLNARDAMPDGGTLTLRTAALRPGAPLPAGGGRRPTAHAGPCVLLSVADSGTGMDELTRAQAFEPFFTTKAPGKGTGLGLATVYGIVEQSGGTVWLDSAPERGTTVWICLPAVDDAAPTADAPAPARQPASRAGTVLVVEDEDGVRAVARRALAAHGHQVLEARNGVDALAHWRAAIAAGTAIDAVITDVVMPGMGGRELARHLRATHPALPVVFMSGYVEGGVPELPDHTPRTAFIEKPFAADALAERLRGVLEG